MQTTDFDFERIPALLLSWYDENKRDLAWRKNPTPYRVWVSEIMLQQTRVEAVKEYYARFMRELPTVATLADCAEEKLLKLWEGLGYYSRARNMQKTAKLIMERYGGEFPSEEKDLKNLPGIGAYTVGAIRSIAFGLRAPAVDGNVFRVISRVSQNPTVISEPAYRSYLERKLLEVYPERGERCSAFTQALMELGALVCKPQAPDCRACPLKGICRAFANGTQAQYPVLPEKKAKKMEKRFVFVIKTSQGVSLRKRTEGVLKGMTEFPSEPNAGKTPEEILNGWGVGEFTLQKRKRYSHIFTHIKWEMECLLVEAENSPFESRTIEEIKTKVSLPTAFKQCLSILE